MMFEREFKDLQFVKRWGIVRMHHDQSVAEHTFCVMAYANDLCVYLDVPMKITLTVLQRAIFHDADEIFTSDIPGPNKRALFKSAEKEYKRTLNSWMTQTFEGIETRQGPILNENDEITVKMILKCADWLDAAMQLSTEVQMGNANAAIHIDFNVDKCIEILNQLHLHLNSPAKEHEKLTLAIIAAVRNARYGKSKGTLIAGEN